MKSFISSLQTLYSEGKAGTCLKLLLKRVEEPDTHINIRIFIVKLVLNYPDVFKSTAAEWWKPLGISII